MIHIIIGPPACGKSDYAEHLLGMAAPPHTYIACLPNVPRYREKIIKHQLRRPTSWQTLELSGDPDQDSDAAIRAIRTSASVLFDGLSFYLLRLFYLGRCALDLHSCFLAMLNDAMESCSLLLVVDAPAPAGLVPDIYKSIVAAHRLLYKRAARITNVSGTSLNALSARDALHLDRC